MAGVRLNRDVVGTTVTPDAGGYWLVAGDGGIFSFGDAHFYGSTGNLRLNQPVRGMASTPDGHGYWLFAGDGGIFSFGDAHFYGSTGNLRLNRPIVGMASTPDGHGYWLFAGDGGVFSFGDAHFYGSTGNLHLTQPVVGMTPSPTGHGYWMVATDGTVFGFGAARGYGSVARAGLGQPVAQLLPARDGNGYWEIANDGDVYPFGSATGRGVPTFAVLHRVLTPGDAAMEWAMAQLGKPYQWGGSGPATFDCSGLVMRAWQAAGVDIPRVAATQYGFGTHVAVAQLRTGDLVFWADNPAQPSSIYHVAMYVGGHHMVNAPYTGQVVRTDWIGGPGFVNTGTRP
jgi:cell wall-associated NlpC family hydrolase